MRITANRGGTAYPINLDAQRAWHDRQAGAAPPPHPRPEVPCRLATPQEIMRCDSIGKLRQYARAHDWWGNITYARGWEPGHRPPEKPSESLALRLRHPATGETKWGAVAVYGARPGAEFEWDLAYFWLGVGNAATVKWGELKALIAHAHFNPESDWLGMSTYLGEVREKATRAAKQAAETRAAQAATKPRSAPREFEGQLALFG